MSALVRLVDVHKSFRSRAEVVHAVRGASLTLEPGTTTAVIGRSGSGKTTLINLIVGWERPDTGKVEGVKGGRWEDASVVPQGIALMPELTLEENLALPLMLGNRSSKAVSDLASALGLDDVALRYPGEVSLGEQQRAAVARALVSGPAVLVADEPTSHQDEANTRAIAELLVGASRRGGTVLVTTHDRRVLAGVDRVLEMSDGVIAEVNGDEAL